MICSMDSFQCAGCGDFFRRTARDEEARRAFESSFGGVRFLPSSRDPVARELARTCNAALDAKASVCDECYEQFMIWAETETEASAAA